MVILNLLVDLGDKIVVAIDGKGYSKKLPKKEGVSNLNLRDLLYYLQS